MGQLTNQASHRGTQWLHWWQVLSPLPVEKLNSDREALTGKEQHNRFPTHSLGVGNMLWIPASIDFQGSV